MALSKPLRWLFRTIVGLVSVLLLLIALLAFVRIPIDLTAYKDVIERIVTDAIGRQVTVDTKIKVTTSLSPAFELVGLRIQNRPDFKTSDFAQMDRARIQVRLLPLLRGKIYVDDFSVTGLALFLEENQTGNVNWTFSDPASIPAAKNKKPKSAPTESSRSVTSDSLVVQKIELKDISISYKNPKNREPLEFGISRCSGAALAGQPFHLDLRGALLSEPYSASIESASLEEFLEFNRSWTNIKINIANAGLKFSGNLDLATATRRLQLGMEVEGRQLDRFDRMLNLDLPPIPHYGVKSSLTLIPGRLELSGMELFVSESKMKGQLIVDISHEQPQVELDLQAPRIQIDDFVFPNWSPRPETPPLGSKSKKPALPEKGATIERPDAIVSPVAELLAPETLRKMNLHLRVRAEQVLSGKDSLGGGHMAVKLEEGRIAIDPVSLNLPGGSLDVRLSIKPDAKDSQAWLQAKVKNFDLGVLAHRTDPQSDMGGTLNLDVELGSKASKLSEILSNGNGHFDFSVHPKNFRAGILDLWAINLLQAVVARSDKNQSRIECLIGRWRMQNGNLKPEALVVDTSRMRICGSGWVDFKARELYLKVIPLPKKPVFLSLATPIQVKGRFSDFRVRISPGGLLGSSIKIVTSPLHVPLARLAKVSLPKDGSDVCGMPLGPDNRPTELPAGCSGTYE